MQVAISKLRYSTPDNMMIDAQVSVDGGAPFPFTYSPSDYSPVSNAVRSLLAEGGYSIAAYSPPPPTQTDYSTAAQEHIDSVARARGYESGVACASYATSTNTQWSSEAAAFIKWRDDVWSYAYTELAQVQAGQIAQPSVGEFVAGLPIINWPGR